MNEDQYWVIAGAIIGLFAMIGMALILRLIRKESSQSNEE